MVANSFKNPYRIKLQRFLQAFDSYRQTCSYDAYATGQDIAKIQTSQYINDTVLMPYETAVALKHPYAIENEVARIYQRLNR